MDPVSEFKTAAIRTAPTGPLHGILEIASAAETATRDNTLDSFSPSTDNNVTTICTSFYIPLGKVV